MPTVSVSPSLYQLRGRIGRSSQQAYAYFLLDPERGDIGEQAQKRLEAIRDFCQLGAGYKIAEFDLLLRGAGSLLGNRQHGHVEALGFDYYLQLLQQSVDALKGNASESLSVELRVHFAYAIADTYIEETAERMRIYQEIAAAQAPADLLRLKEEMEDRFGRMPESMEKALGVGAVKLFARLYRWPKAEVFSDRVCVQASQPPRRDAGPLLRRLQVRWEEPQTLVLPFGALDNFIRLGQRLGEAL